MTEEEKEARRRKEFEYQFLHQTTLHESKSPWEVSSVFITTNSIVAGAIALILTNENNHIPEFKLIISMFVGLGILVSILWLLAINRIIKLYFKRRKLAKKLEKDLDIFIFRGRIASLANKGFFKSFHALRWVILFFIALYLFFLVIIFRENIQNLINCL